MCLSDNVVTSIIKCMASNESMEDIQRTQTDHRIKLVQFWGIKEGSRVLEIGCGQGDTTAVLAYFVGEKGFVQGIDIASPDYGSPITLGDSANYLLKSKLGSQIKMDFNIDVLATDYNFPNDTFDYIVLSHCSWYLKSFDELEEILEKIEKWGKKLCFAEWDPLIQTIEQYPHFLAALIQAQYESFKESSLSNIRTIFTPMDIRTIVEKTNWRIINEQLIESPNLQDGKWEIDLTLSYYKEEINNLVSLPDKLKSLIQSEIMLLKEASINSTILPMSIYTLIAE